MAHIYSFYLSVSWAASILQKQIFLQRHASTEISFSECKSPVIKFVKKTTVSVCSRLPQKTEKDNWNLTECQAMLSFHHFFLL